MQFALNIKNVYLFGILIRSQTILNIPLGYALHRFTYLITPQVLWFFSKPLVSFRKCTCSAVEFYYVPFFMVMLMNLHIENIKLILSLILSLICRSLSICHISWDCNRDLPAYPISDILLQII